MLCTNLKLLLLHTTHTPDLWLSSSSPILAPQTGHLCSIVRSKIVTYCFQSFVFRRLVESFKGLAFMFAYVRDVHTVAATTVACFASLTCSPAIHLTLLFQIHFLMILSANWAYLKDASQMHAYQDIKMKEERELQDITSRSKECLNSYT